MGPKLLRCGVFGRQSCRRLVFSFTEKGELVMRAFLFLAVLGSAGLALANYPPTVDPDKPQEDTDEVRLLSAITHLAMEAGDFHNDVMGEASYKRSRVPAARLVSLSNKLMQAVEEGGQCVQLRVLIEGVKHRHTVLRRGFESDHAIWKVARVGWAFNSLAESYRVFNVVSGRYLNSRECYQHPRERW